MADDELEYGAISLDTSIFRKESYKLESGLLNQMQQFKEGHVDFILSEVVGREVLSHIKSDAKVAKFKFEKAIRNAGKHHLIDDAKKNELENLFSNPSPVNIAKGRIQFFFDQTGCENVAAKMADIEQLVDLYFLMKPPFEGNENKGNDENDKKNKKNKKYEFPDAIALLSLEAWAKENQKKIIAVSTDEGWIKFGEQSSWIDVQKDLAEALDVLQSQKRKVDIKEKVKKILSEINAGELVGIRDELHREILKTLEYQYIMADGVSDMGFYFYGEVNEIEYKYVKYTDKLSIVELKENELTLRISLEVSYNAVGSFELYVPDREGDVHMGSTDVEKSDNFDMQILLKLGGDFSGSEFNFEDAEILEIEAIDTPTIYFDSIDTNWGQE